MSENTTVVKGLSLTSIVFIILLCAKLLGLIAWSWWLITIPLWGGLALVVAGAILVGAVYGIYKLCKKIGSKAKAGK